MAMTRAGRAMLILLAACLPGCAGVPSTSQLPYLAPANESIHAKPDGNGYLARHDSHPSKLTVLPREASAETRARVIVIATVTDGEGNPLRNCRVEWLLEGVGSIIEVDQRGELSTHGYKVDNRYAVS